MNELTTEQRQLVEAAVEQTMLKLGVDVSNPEEIIQLQQDFQHLRKWRKTVNQIESKSVLTIVGIFATGVAAAIWLGFKQLVTGE